MYTFHAIQRNARLLADQIGTINGIRTRTWTEIEQRVAKLAGALAAQGVKSGDRVAILAMNSDRYFEYYHAVPWSGAVVVPLNIRWSVKENLYSLEDSESTVLFVDDAFLKTVEQLLPECSHIRLVIYIGDAETPPGMLNYEQLIKGSERIDPVTGGYDDLMGVFYTGGTTGFPKGVMLSHRNIWSSSISILAELDISHEGGRYLHAAPMFHLADTAFGQISTIAGLTQVFVPFFEPESVVNMISAQEVTHILLVPTMITMLLATPALDGADVSSLKTIIYGASPMPEGTLIEAMDKLPVVGFIQAYGQTELSPLCSLLTAEFHVLKGPKSGKIGSAGRPGYCVDVEIRAIDGSVLQDGEVGEIAVQGPNTMVGYWNKPEQTASAIVDGWLMTGDAGYIDEDGFIFLVDRVKDMIVSGGENVFSAEVENAISHHCAVQESIVIGIPSEEWGESVHAIIRLKEGKQANQEDIIAHCREYIAGYKVPRSVEFRCEAFPMTGAGKVRKTELRKPYWTGLDRVIN